jgi:hypothetical protein
MIIWLHIPHFLTEECQGEAAASRNLNMIVGTFHVCIKLILEFIRAIHIF